MKTRVVKIGSLKIGGGNPIAVQSMTNTKTRDIRATVSQIKRLERAGCEIVRVAVPDEKSAKCLGRIKSKINIPLVADIHFNHRLALIALEEGVDKLRINPGNIGTKEKVREVVMAAKKRRVPIRIGVNSGSVEKKLLRRYKGPTARAMVESAMGHIRILESLNFRNIVISLKAADVRTTIEAYRIISEKVRYPLHVGVTEAGTKWAGSIYSAVGIGALLSEGIGDTLRVSLTAQPEEELPVAWEILKSLGLRKFGPHMISCPTCARTRVGLIEMAEKVENALRKVAAPIKVAVMGCEVNGPGEAKEADIGIACGKGFGWIFKKGKRIRKVREASLVASLLKEVKSMTKKKKAHTETQRTQRKR